MQELNLSVEDAEEREQWRQRIWASDLINWDRPKEKKKMDESS